jgi:uncharacterized protein (TIGR02246 family)
VARPSTATRETDVSLRSRQNLAVLAAVALVGGCAPVPVVEAPPPAASATVQAPVALRTTWQAYSDAWSRGDPAAFARFYTPDTHAMIFDRMHHGGDAIVAEWIRPTVSAMRGMVATPESFQEQGNRVIETGRYEITVEQPGQAAQRQTGTYRHVWERAADGQWRLVEIRVS